MRPTSCAPSRLVLEFGAGLELDAAIAGTDLRSVVRTTTPTGLEVRDPRHHRAGRVK